MGSCKSKEAPQNGVEASEASVEKIRLVMAGQAGVGKSTLISKLMSSDTGSEQKGDDFDVFEKLIKTPNGKSALLLINDTAGQEKFRTITASFYNRTAGVVMVFDVCDQTSYDSLENWFNEVERYASSASLILIGNKTDLTDRRQVDKERGMEDYAQEKGITYIETSALTGENVELAFGMIADTILDVDH